MPPDVADKTPPQPIDCVGMEAETIIIHLAPKGEQALAVPCRVQTLSGRPPPKKPRSACREGHAQTKLAARAGAKGERHGACQLPHCTPVFAQLGSGRGFRGRTVKGQYCGLRRKHRRKQSLHTFQFCRRSSTAGCHISLLLVTARRWGMGTPLRPRVVSALPRRTGCLLLARHPTQSKAKHQHHQLGTRLCCCISVLLRGLFFFPQKQYETPCFFHSSLNTVRSCP